MEKESPVFSKDLQSLFWCGTLNNPTREDEALLILLEKTCSYLILGREHWPKEGEPIDLEKTPHYQIFLKLLARKRLAGMKKLLPRAHWEMKSPFSTVQQALEYCKKEGDFVEFGEVPKEKTEPATKKAADNWNEAKQLALEGRVLEIDPQIFIKYYGQLKKIANDAQSARDIEWLDSQTKHIWIHGPTGTGKSFRARKEFAKGERFYNKMLNKWWDAYADEDIAIMDDIGQTHSWMGDHLKQWLDIYPFMAEVKLGTKLIRPGLIIITSNYKPEELFPDPAVHLPIKRRIKEIFMGTPFNAQLGLTMEDREIEGAFELKEVMGTCHVDGSGAVGPKLVKVPLTRQNAVLGAVTINPDITMVCTVPGCHCDQHQDMDEEEEAAKEFFEQCKYDNQC